MTLEPRLRAVMLKWPRGPDERRGMPVLEGLQHLVALLLGVSIGFALMHALRG